MSWSSPKFVNMVELCLKTGCFCTLSWPLDPFFYSLTPLLQSFVIFVGFGPGVHIDILSCKEKKQIVHLMKWSSSLWKTNLRPHQFLSSSVDCWPICRWWRRWWGSGARLHQRHQLLWLAQSCSKTQSSLVREPSDRQKGGARWRIWA